MERDSRVYKIYLYHTQMAGQEGVSLMVNICDDFSKVNNKDVVIQGRFPEFENEIAIAVKYAREHGFRLADEIRLGSGEKEGV